MKILFFIDSLRAGGKERQAVEIMKNLSLNKDYRIFLVLMSKDIFYDEILEYDIEIDFVIRQKKKDFGVFFKLFKIIKKYKPDIIHTWDSTTSFYALFVSKLFNLKMINGSIRHGIRLNKKSHKIRTLIAKVSPYVIANSQAGLTANGLKRDKKHFVLYNGINKKFKQFKNREFYAKDKYTFLSISSLTPYKDYFTVIKALKRLKENNYNFIYNIIGEGPLREEIIDFIKKLNLENHIKLLGAKKDIQQYLANADIFIHSSKGEGCSNVILEAMYSGLPILATNTGGTKEIVTPDNGYLFNYKHEKELYEKLKHLVDNPELCEKFSKNSVKIVEKRFTTDIMIKNYTKILYNIIND